MKKNIVFKTNCVKAHFKFELVQCHLWNRSWSPWLQPWTSHTLDNLQKAKFTYIYMYHARYIPFYNVRPYTQIIVHFIKEYGIVPISYGCTEVRSQKAIMTWKSRHWAKRPWVVVCNEIWKGRRLLRIIKIRLKGMDRPIRIRLEKDPFYCGGCFIWHWTTQSPIADTMLFEVI